ncbi:MAG: ribulose-phosphate 3-epimerase [Firmicutes bacterium]|nr:ribulose-phosphate 3-epimerase [Bacillota bacterium]
MKIIAPSVLTADLWNMSSQIEAFEKGGCSWLHLDIMDGHFVPNISFGPMLLRSLRPMTEMCFDAHLMIENPEDYVDAFAAAGADMITVHAEACVHLHRTLQIIKKSGKKCGVALNPSTPLAAVEEILPVCDMILIMSVNPGFGGQSFIDLAEDKIKRLRKMIDDRGLHTLIEVDGGINFDNVQRVAACGADILVSGNALFSAHDLTSAFKDMTKLANQEV